MKKIILLLTVLYFTNTYSQTTNKTVLPTNSMNDYKCSFAINNCLHEVGNLTFTPNGKYLLYSENYNRKIYVFDLKKKSIVNEINNTFSDYYLSQDGKYILLDQVNESDENQSMGTVQVYDIEAQKIISEFKFGINILLEHISLSRNNKYLAVSLGDESRVYDFFGKQLLSRIPTPDYPRHMQFTNDNKLLIIAYYKRIDFVDLNNFSVVHSINLNSSFNSMDVSKNDKYMAVTFGQNAIIYDIKTKMVKLNISRGTDLDDVTFSKDNGKLAFREDYKKIIIYNINESKVVSEIDYTSTINSIAFSSNSSVLAFGTPDKGALIIKTTTYPNCNEKDDLLSQNEKNRLRNDEEQKKIDELKSYVYTCKLVAGKKYSSSSGSLKKYTAYLSNGKVSAVPEVIVFYEDNSYRKIVIGYNGLLTADFTRLSYYDKETEEEGIKILLKEYLRKNMKAEKFNF